MAPSTGSATRGGQRRGASTTGGSRRAQLRRFRELLSSERDAAALYRSLAETTTGERRAVFLELATIEDRHAAHWAEKLREAGATVPDASRPSLRTRLLAQLARRTSVDRVLPFVERAERADAGKYDVDPDAAEGMAHDERSHARRLARLRQGRPTGRERIARREPWHRRERSGALRAGVFGVSDGLVSNASLVLGVAGSGTSRSAIVLAGVAGLVAGAFSMAAGEYVSMASQRETYEREITLEAQELEEKPEEEHDELILLYRAKGLDRGEAKRVADQIMADREAALDTLVREELGLDPDELGSPIAAAVSSFLTFAAGALVILLPYLVASGTAAFVAAVLAFGITLFAVGAGIGLLSGRSWLRAGARQLLVGGLAAGVTYGVGHAIGVTTS